MILIRRRSIFADSIELQRMSIACGKNIVLLNALGISAAFLTQASIF
ncbi:MAG: hypothetical protein ACJARY_003231 [Candidatus Azotimanducaceae bacterium]|jgi:hypothetical protein